MHVAKRQSKKNLSLFSTSILSVYSLPFQAKELQTELEEAEKNVTELKGNIPGDPFRMTKRKRMSRIKCPTMLKKEDSQALDNGKSASSVRRKELLEASYQISGATIVNRKPALDGLWITAIRALSGKDLFENSKHH